VASLKACAGAGPILCAPEMGLDMSWLTAARNQLEGSSRVDASRTAACVNPVPRRSLGKGHGED
jgi:hypothetical protein